MDLFKTNDINLKIPNMSGIKIGILLKMRKIY